MTTGPGHDGRVDAAAVILRSEQRKKELRCRLSETMPYIGGTGRRYRGVLDAYHGETGFDIDPAAARALRRAWDDLTSDRSRRHELPDYDKRQPLELRELAAAKLFDRLAGPAESVRGVRVRPDEVVVCPYSSMLLLEEVIATVVRPGGVIVCPEGFYKNFATHVAKFDVRVVVPEATPGDEFRIDPDALTRALDRHGDAVCAVLLTLPGNPVVSSYSLAESAELARILVAARVPVVCDMAFDRLVPGHIPLAAFEVPTAGGPVRLYDRMVTVTGNSKGYNAFGPCKLGAACSGDSEWLARVRARLTIAFQRESTHLVRAVLEHTPEAYFEHNRKLVREQFDTALERIAALDAEFGGNILRPLGSGASMFLSVVADPGLLSAAGVRTSAELEDLLLVGAGVDSVALGRTGSARLGVRLNVLAPRRGPGTESRELIDELFDRLAGLIGEIRGGRTYHEILRRRGIAEFVS
ncbi:pyridoxal phosphate-dependent aminotransferase [Nocardia spumae]|uniref:pyridoxal phosphate-dependent aminotransferase n=1 Tax=Nocardia spumae TaxID=2887190 RepID=UPI001D14375D|nr:pyridoxal phosphate-dependent aminotransferase [Nocardia spumae]